MATETDDLVPTYADLFPALQAASASADGPLPYVPVKLSTTTEARPLSRAYLPL